MKRTGFCIAGALAFAVSAAAQTPTSTTADMQSRMNDAMRDVSVVGCLAKGTDGTYTLTNARMDMGTTDNSRTSTTAGSTTGTTGAAPTNTAEAVNANMGSAMTWWLRGGTDLDKHVGHRIQVMGKSSWKGPTMSNSRMTNPTSSTTAGTGSTTTTGTGATTTAGAGATTTAGSTSTTAGSTSTTTANSASTTAGPDGQPRLDVQSVKMIASSCS